MMETTELVYLARNGFPEYSVTDLLGVVEESLPIARRSLKINDVDQLEPMLETVCQAQSRVISMCSRSSSDSQLELVRKSFESFDSLLNEFFDYTSIKIKLGSLIDELKEHTKRRLDKIDEYVNLKNDHQKKVQWGSRQPEACDIEKLLVRNLPR